MTIINISQQPYSFRNKIAGEIAEKLGYKLIDKDVISNKVKGFYCNFSDELHDLANEKEPGFFKNRKVYNCLVQSIFFEEASHDNVVINGLGGQFILNRPYALNIRLIAPFDVRCSYLGKETGLNHDAARKLLQKKDQGQKNFIQYLFKKESSDTSFYDLTFNNHKLDFDVIFSTIANYAGKIDKTQPLTDDEKETLRRCSLEKRVEATIEKKISDHEQLKVECCKLGDIRIKGFVINGTKADKINKLAQLCHGVNSIENQLVRMLPGV